MKALVTKVFVALLWIYGSSCRHTETSAELATSDPGAITIDPAMPGTETLGWMARSNYVAMSIPFAPIQSVKNQVEAREGLTLQSRGEAHITVVTPPELNILRTRLSLEQINGLVEKMRIQNIPIRLQCLGRVQKHNGRRLASYFLVVRAPGLLQVREKLRQHFVAAGGDRQAFMVENFAPHITVGFTERDLHEADGVIKDSKSCLYKVE